MTILITGANGQVGQSLQLAFKPFSGKVRFLNRHELDITDKVAIEKQIQQSNASLIINAAAYTQVDLAETERESCSLINTLGAENLARSCAAANIPLLHFSTDYVFDGKKNTPYTEKDEAHPLNYYGLSKYEGEQAIRNNLKQHLIIRVSGVFSVFQSNFVKRILALSKTHTELRIINDQFICPTSAHKIAEFCYQLLQSPEFGKAAYWGTYHFCSQEPCTWYEFTQAIFNEAKHYTNQTFPSLIPISYKAYPTAAIRPNYSVLNCEKIATHFAFSLPSWRDSLRPVIKELLS